MDFHNLFSYNQPVLPGILLVIKLSIMHTLLHEDYNHTFIMYNDVIIIIIQQNAWALVDILPLPFYTNGRTQDLRLSNTDHDLPAANNPNGPKVIIIKVVNCKLLHCATDNVGRLKHNYW